MGNTSSNPIEESRRAAQYADIRKNRVRGTVYRDYRPPIQPNHQASNRETSEENDDRSSSGTPTKAKSSAPSATTSTTDPSADQKRQALSASALAKSDFPPAKEISVPPPIFPISGGSARSVKATHFEKAPAVHMNYVARQSDKNSPHVYARNEITIVRRTSSQPMSSGNRWYDNN